MRTDSKTVAVGNDTLFGQVATFMETLHLTYHEVLEEIPYRNLLMMQRDKLHTCDRDDIVVRTTGAEMMKRRMGQN